MFEFLLVEWHITPDYIINNWTDELLELMSDKLSERKEREQKALDGKPQTTEVSEEVFLERASNLIEVKHGS